MTGFQRKIILKALDNPEKLSEWEIDFINDLAKKSDDYQVSEKQNKILDRILTTIDFGY